MRAHSRGGDFDFTLPLETAHLDPADHLRRLQPRRPARPDAAELYQVFLELFLPTVIGGEH